VCVYTGERRRNVAVARRCFVLLLFSSLFFFTPIAVFALVRVLVLLVERAGGCADGPGSSRGGSRGGSRVGLAAGDSIQRRSPSPRSPAVARTIPLADRC